MDENRNYETNELNKNETTAHKGSLIFNANYATPILLDGSSNKNNASTNEAVSNGDEKRGSIAFMGKYKVSLGES